MADHARTEPSASAAEACCSCVMSPCYKCLAAPYLSKRCSHEYITMGVSLTSAIHHRADIDM